MGKSILNPGDFRNPVVFFANGVGDHLIFLPTFRALAMLFEGKITFIGLPRVKKMFFDGLPVRRVIELHLPFRSLKSWNLGLHRGELEALPLNDVALRRDDVDLFISACTWHSKPIFDFMQSIAPAKTIGFFPEFNYHVSYTGHSFDEYFFFAKLFSEDQKIESHASPPTLSKKNQATLANLKLIKDFGHKILVVHTDTKKRKMLRSDTLLKAVDLFLTNKKDYLAILVGLRHSLRLDQANNTERIIDFCRLPLELTFGIVGQSDLFLGIDSSMLHVADLYRVPGVAVFGPTAQNEWGFKFSRHVHISSPELDTVSELEILQALLHIEIDV